MDTHAASKNGRHTILLGGIGGDSHSVGLTILRQGLSMDGYHVSYIGTQNSLDDFFRLAGFCNAVMISSLDGHARYYLRRFPELMNRYKVRRPLWYLGGNLHIGDGVGYEREFLEMGFSRALVKFVDIESVLGFLRRDLHGVEPAPHCPALWESMRSQNIYVGGTAADNLLELDSFERSRVEVLAHWKTGARAKNLDENAEFLQAQPSFPKLQTLVNAGQQPMLVQPRSGVPLLEQQIKLFKAFKSVGVRVLSYQVDSLTRNNNYVGAEEAIRESRATKTVTLNGFPIVNHGVTGLRRVINALKVPLQARHSTRDPRLLAEICYAGGVTSFEGGAICYNIPYYKNYPLDESIENWQYVDRLTGLYYQKFGIILDREFFGTLTATLIPPSLAISVNIIQSVLAARQGVKSVSLGYAEQGHRIQDIAAIRTLHRMATEYLSNLGHKDVQVSTVFHQYMASFPPSAERAADLIYNSAITAALSGATRVIGKTPVEASKIPTMEENMHGINLIHTAIADAARHPFDETRVEEECAIIRREVEAILSSVIYCGRGDIACGIVTGFQKGFIDIPFSPSIYSRGEVITARDTEGAVRFLSVGELQFDGELRSFHDEKMNARRRAEGLLSKQQDYLLVERDTLQLARNEYEHWPLFR